ncbi:MAG: hypothetical protein HQ498_01185, partial [Pseudohongiella sp.]|nr:hypothetical protein [Pseudohongiella sp.]
MLLASCMTIDLETNFVEDEALHRLILDQSVDRYPDIDPLYISDEVKHFIDAYINPRDNDEQRVDKLQDLLYGEDYLYIKYVDSKTHTAMEAFNAREGNCLSVINLYVAMARYAGVDAEFQTVEVQPSWDMRGDLLVLSQHINATGRFTMRRRYVVDFTPEIALQQLTAEVVSDQEARSLYFNNLGVESMIAGKPEQALPYFKNSLFLNADLSIGWNNIGAAYNRLGNSKFAEYAYRMAFNHDESNATAINNLSKFYRQNGNPRLAREYESAMRKFNNRNPYFHYVQGSLAFLDNDFEAARDAFHKALRIKKQEPDFYLALASVYLKLGDVKRAQSYTESAEELLTQNEEIYRPSRNKVRVIDSDTILRPSSAG